MTPVLLYLGGMWAAFPFFIEGFEKENRLLPHRSPGSDCIIKALLLALAGASLNQFGLFALVVNGSGPSRLTDHNSAIGMQRLDRIQEARQKMGIPDSEPAKQPLPVTEVNPDTPPSAVRRAATYRLPMTMGEKGAVRAVGDLEPAVVIPIHLGLQPRSPLMRTSHSPADFSRRLREAGLATKVVVLNEGESWAAF